MTVFLILALSAGLLLGYRFKILILVPVIAVALFGLIGAGLARADDAWSICLMAVAVTIALEIGYLVGSGVYAYGIGRRAAALEQGGAPRQAALRWPAH